MALKLQFNKTFLQHLQKQLKIRENALPTLQAKEAALRLEVKKAREELDSFSKSLESKRSELARYYLLWSEFPEDILAVKNVDMGIKKIAGVNTPVFKKVDFSISQFSLFNAHAWVPRGLEMLKEIIALEIQKAIAEKKSEILEHARKKTTQKVNLYEKVQIPEYQEGLLKIKRFMEDEDNLAKSSQKILKQRLAGEAA